MKKAHITVLAVTGVLYLGSLIWFLAAYKSIPEWIGIHFDPKGFDVYAEKIFGFYPFVAGSVLTGVLQLVRFLAGKLKGSKKLNDEGNKKFKRLIEVYADTFTVMIAVFFTSWNAAVITQYPKIHCSYIYNALMTFIPLMVLALPVFDIVYKHKYKNQDYKKERKKK